MARTNLEPNQVVHIYHRLPPATGPGAATSGAFFTRVLNTLDNPNAVTWVTLDTATNRFTLQAGTYEIDVQVPGMSVNEHVCKLYNISTSTDSLTGDSPRAVSGQQVTVNSTARGVITISSAQVYEIQQRVTTSNASLDALGAVPPAGPAFAVFTQVKIRRIA